MGHFIENLSDDEDVEVLEIFRADKFQDFSLFQWLGVTPQNLVKDHLFANSPKEAKEFEEALKDVRPDPIKDVDWDSLIREEKVEL
jgi:oxalate decarboxylase/phosphoglucose isomerase-like protein (cupin superfamily)